MSTGAGNDVLGGTWNGGGPDCQDRAGGLVAEVRDGSGGAGGSSAEGMAT